MFFAVTINIENTESKNSNIMGIDIGLRQLAVASVQNQIGKEFNRQFYNDDYAGFIRKKFRSLSKNCLNLKRCKQLKLLKTKSRVR